MSASPYRIRPSNAERLCMCPGSLAICEAYPKAPTEESMTGDAVHWAAAEILHGRAVARGQCAANGVTLTEAMIDAADFYADYIKRRGAGVGNVEVLVTNDALHPTANGGTPDHYVFLVIGDRLHIFIDDYKNGHKYVSIIGNKQLLNYAALILRSIAATWGDWTKIDITMTIFQPNNYHRDGPIRAWTICAIDLVPYFETMRVAYARAMEPDAPCIAADPDICDDCSGRWVCEAALAAASNSVPHSYSSTPLNMSPAAMALEQRILSKAAKRIEARLSGLEEEMTGSIRRGVKIPGNKLDADGGKVVWLVPKDQVSTLGQSLGVPLDKHDVLTPTQAGTAFKKAGLPPELIEAYSYRQAGKVKLVQYDSKELANIFKP